MRLTALVFASLLSATAVAQVRQYPVHGMVLRVDRDARTVFVSHDRIEGLMEAMAMPFPVRDARDLDGLAAGALVDFTLTIEARTSYASRIRVRRYESVQQDPLNARRLALLDRISRGSLVGEVLSVGEAVPDFMLIDQARRPVSLSQLRGSVVALNFIYTSCALPQYCYLMASHFGVLYDRFSRELASGQLRLLTVTFDPARDTPEILARYASRWDADPALWHFLTGDIDAVQALARRFGLAFFPNEGLMDHSLRTAVIDRQGRLRASIEGNQYTPRQLGDLVEKTLRP